MGLSLFQRRVCRLLADDRVRNGESYLEALAVSCQTDRATLERSGFEVRVFRERSGFVEAEIRQGADAVLMQWARDSAFRFFPLVEHPDFGLTLPPFDLATSKVLALVGRGEPRDFVDTLRCDRDVQPLGYLAWAATAAATGTPCRPGAA